MHHEDSYSFCNHVSVFQILHQGLNTMKTRKPKAVVFVSGGVVQDIVMNDPNMEVILVDYDTDGCDPSKLKKDRDGKTCHYGVWSGSEYGNVKTETVRYWKDKDRAKKARPLKRRTILDLTGRVCNLSEEVYRIVNKPEEVLRGLIGYQNGDLVRLISGIDDVETGIPSKTPGYHQKPEFRTVCSVNAKEAMWIGFKETELVPVTEQDQEPKKIEFGFCAKCCHKIVKPHTFTKKDGSCPMAYDELVGCEIEKDPKMGENCPLITKR